MLTEKEQLIFDRFRKDFRDFLIEQISEFISINSLEIEIQSKRYLETAKCEDLLRLYLYNKQKIPSGKKNVYYSKEIIKSPLYKAFYKRISVICNTLKQGYSIAPYLTNRTNNLKFEDRLLNDWGINHLHLQPIGQRNVATDGILLFAYFYADAVFLLNIGNHGNFTDRMLLKIIDNNWSDLLETFNGINPSNLTEKQIMGLRKNNIAYTLQINNKVIATGTGYMRNRMLPPIAIFRSLEDIAKIVASNENTFQNAIKEQSKNNSEVEVHLSFDAKNKEVILYDSKTMIGFKFNNIDHFEVLNNILKNTHVF